MNVLAISGIPCWLIPILVGLICAILGYLLGRLFSNGSDDGAKVNVDVYRNRISKLEADLEACKSSKKSTYSGGNSSLGAVSSFAGDSISEPSKREETKAVVFDLVAAKAVFGKNIKQDDLTIVEGIGPKIKELFHNHGVTTWSALADCSVEKCLEVLKSGGKRFEIHKPGTWPKQASLAALGQWQELKDWQDKLDGGK
ncbi:hypothetical protein [Lacinutrix sp. 5H-3-7-4]|uniref:hypothetical protein n=1 Tax=Lacinutrix sp. (strain 5H-3-7-4) TaxID=983544 RepID=UPI00020A35AC|nr:hypothetical protein [Lacinutrix sp. 5H-3-7-4]AEH00755.1 hypothetical protein Lacal_0907 [Lacinutrix sp. 5H-3-7-4]